MIQVYSGEIDGLWFTVGLENEIRVFSTSFGTSEEESVKGLLMSLPKSLSFRRKNELNLNALKLLNALKALFEGKDVSLNFQIVLEHLPAYTRSVLECVSTIPIGYLTTYSAVAKVVGGSPRSVGQAVASNPVPLLIPCHRVVRKDFYPGGYKMGGTMKSILLQHENKQYLEARTQRMNRKVLNLFPIRFLKYSSTRFRG